MERSRARIDALPPSVYLPDKAAALERARRKEAAIIGHDLRLSDGALCADYQRANPPPEKRLFCSSAQDTANKEHTNKRVGGGPRPDPVPPLYDPKLLPAVPERNEKEKKPAPAF